MERSNDEHAAREQTARVWWPSTAKKKKQAGTGKLWQAIVSKVTPKFYSALYEDGALARVHEKYVFLGQPPVDFGQELLGVQAGEFVEVLGDADCGGSMSLGVVQATGADLLVSVSYPFLANAKPQRVQACFLRRFRCLQDGEWRLLTPRQTWPPGQVPSPHELSTISESQLGSFVEQPAGRGGSASTAAQPPPSDVQAARCADQLTKPEPRRAARGTQAKGQPAGQPPSDTRQEPLPRQQHRSTRTAAAAPAQAPQDLRQQQQRDHQQQQRQPPHRSTRTAVLGTPDAQAWLGSDTRDVGRRDASAASSSSGNEAGIAAAGFASGEAGVLSTQLGAMRLTPAARVQDACAFPAASSPHVNSAARRRPLRAAALPSHLPTPAGATPEPAATTSYEISPYCGSDSECSDDEDDDESPDRKPRPQWAQGSAVLAAVERQRGVDPDAVFGAVPGATLDMERIFTDQVTPGTDWRDWRDARGSTGCWKDDALRTEEKAAYRATLGYQ